MLLSMILNNNFTIQLCIFIENYFSNIIPFFFSLHVAWDLLAMKFISVNVMRWKDGNGGS